MSQPSGWYDDPQDPALLRYWDGVMWTDHTTPKRSPSAAGSSAGRAPDVPAYGSPPPPPAQGYPTAPPQYDQPPTAYGYGAAPQAPWSSAGPTARDGTPLADWWQRLLARLLDNILLGVVVLVVGFPWLSGLAAEMGDFFDEALRDAEAGITTVPDTTALSEALIGYIVPLTFLNIAVSVLYETFFLMRSGATPGKKALGITVRRVERPGALRLSEALRRQAIPVGCAVLSLVPVVSLLATLAQLLDNLWLLWDPRRQTWHDKVADTLVVRVPRLR